MHKLVCAFVVRNPEDMVSRIDAHMHLVARNPTLLHSNNKGAVQPAHPHNVINALDGVIAKLLHAQRIQNRAYREHVASFYNI